MRQMAAGVLERPSLKLRRPVNQATSTLETVPVQIEPFAARPPRTGSEAEPAPARRGRRVRVISTRAGAELERRDLSRPLRASFGSVLESRISPQETACR